MKKDIFRKVSLERLRSPDQLDQLITVTSARSWIVLIAIALILFAGITWGIVGQIPTKIKGQGILIAGGGIRNVVHNYGGRITDICVRPGDRVSAGDTVARIDQYDIINQILALKDKLNATRNKEYREKLETQIKHQQSEYEYRSEVTAPVSGKVLEVKLNRGELLKPGEPIISLEQTGPDIRKLEGIIYVSASEGKKLIPGMEVKVSPSFVKKEQYGFILGEVISVSQYPVTYQKMVSFLGNQELAKSFSQNGAPIEVKVELMSDKDTFSGFKWTSPSGPPTKIDSGTLCTASITTGSRHPLELVIPISIGND